MDSPFSVLLSRKLYPMPIRAKPVLTFGTFGIYRWLLATGVVTCHIAPMEYKYTGFYAVFAFFCLSGYIVSYILHSTYFSLRHGIARYFLNRALRIFPLYWLTLLLCWGLFTISPRAGLDLHPMFQAPSDLYGWTINLITFNLSNINGTYYDSMLNPSAWSLGIEMTYWILIPLFWKNKNILALAITLTFIFTGIAILEARDFISMRYESPLAAALPFLLGMGIYQRKTKGPVQWPYALKIAIIAALVGINLLAWALPWHPLFEGLYAALALNALAILILSDINTHSLPPIWKKADRFLGQLAYPIFVVHMPVALALYELTSGAMGTRGWLFCLLTWIGANLMAIVLHQTVETRVERWRKAIKC